MALDTLAGVMRGPSQSVNVIELPGTQREEPVQLGANMAVAGSNIGATVTAGWLALMVVGVVGFYVWTHGHQL